MDARTFRGQRRRGTGDDRRVRDGRRGRRLLRLGDGRRRVNGRDDGGRRRRGRRGRRSQTTAGVHADGGGPVLCRRLRLRDRLHFAMMPW